MREPQDLLKKGLSISDHPSEPKFLPACTSMLGFLKKHALALVQVFQLPTLERWVSEETLRS